MAQSNNWTSFDTIGVSGNGECVLRTVQKDSSAPFKTELTAFIIYYIQLQCKPKGNKEECISSITLKLSYVIIVWEKGWLQHLIYWTSPFYFSILFHMIKSYMHSSFTKLTYAYGYTLPSLLQRKYFAYFKQLICTFLSPLSIILHIYLFLKNHLCRESYAICDSDKHLGGCGCLRRDLLMRICRFMNDRYDGSATLWNYWRHGNA